MCRVYNNILFIVRVDILVLRRSGVKEDQTNGQFLSEISELKHRIAELEKSNIEGEKAKKRSSKIL